MHNQNFEILNVNDGFQDDMSTSRTEDLLFNTKPIDWRKDICVSKENKSYETQCHLNGNNSSDYIGNYVLSNKMKSALEINSNRNLSLSGNKNDLSIDDSLSNNLTPRSQLFNHQARQNIDKFLPKSFQSQFALTNNVHQKSAGSYVSCPECAVTNSSDLDWCVSCGLFLINQKKPNSFSTTSPQPVENKPERMLNEYPKSLIRNKENFSTFENVEDFNRMFKRSAEEEIKLNLTDLEIAESVYPNVQRDLDIDLVEQALNSNNDNQLLSSKLPVIPPLDLSCLDTNRQQNHINNQTKPTRKWLTSSMAWEDKPNSLLKKKPSTFYRNKNASNSNKIGWHVYPSKIPSWDGEDSINQIKLMNVEANYRNMSRSCDQHYIDPIVDIDDGFSTRSELILFDDDINKNSAHLLIDSCNNNNQSNSTNYIRPVGNWQCLPAEIWIKIMLYLPHCDLSRLQRTCRRIYSIGLDSQLWRCVTLFRNTHLTDSDIINIARKMPRELHFKNCVGTSITANGLQEMFHICGCGVEKISFISCSKGALEGDQFLVLSAKFCPNVTHINASYLMNLQDSTLITMTEGFNKIVSLNLMGAHSISNESIKSLIKNHRSSLTSLDLYGCFKLNSATLRILEECLNLKSLALGSINKLKRTSMVELLRNLSQLTNLDLRGTMNLIDDVLLGQICMLCPNLQQIVITNSCLVGNEGLNSLSNSNVSKTLKVLDVCGCARISDKGVEAVLKNCHSLEDLDISCTRITGRIAKLFKTHPPRSLKCLRVNNNKYISGTELASIVGSCKKLTTIYMCGMTSIDQWHGLESKFQNVFFKHE